MNVILVPVYRRPELLYLNLKNLSKCRSIDNYHVVYEKEYDYSDKIDDVIQRFSNILGSDSIMWDSYYGLNKGYLEAVKQLTPVTDDYLIVIEEDVRVTRDFLEWVEYVYRHFLTAEVFSIVGFAHENRPQENITQTDIELVLCGEWHSPYGAVFPKKMLEKIVLPHCTERYYQDRKGYSEALYHLGRWYEQDGLMQRLLITHNLRTLAPKLSRAQHMGYWGRGPYQGEKKTFEDRICEISSILDSEEEYIKRSRATNFAKFRGDYTWENMKLVRK